VIVVSDTSVLSCLLLIDERRGRATSAALGLRMTGAAGVLTDAAASGWVDFEDVFRRLGQTRFRLAEAVVETLCQRFRQRS
jgi:predicted nucleic acid-binding protein